MASPPLPSAPPAAVKRKRSDASDRSSQTYPETAYSQNSEEVAADFSDALQELSGNDRYQISNLTVIAKESLTPNNAAQANANATAISDVLTSHIAKVGPTRKLPALYVLDSIVKNVGEPYRSIFARSLWSTFMDAYTLVDPPTRKQMESMLKTWRDSVAGGIQSNIAFPQEVTKNIETALIRARTVVEQQRHQHASHQQSRSPSAPHQQQQQQQQQPPPPPQQQHHQQYPNPQQYYSPQPVPQPQPHEPYYHPPGQQIPSLISPPLSHSQAYQQPQAPQYQPYQSYPAPTPTFVNSVHSPPQFQNFQPPAPTPHRPNNLDLSALLQQATSSVSQYSTPPPQPQVQSYYQAPQQQQYPPPVQPAFNFPGLEALFRHQKLPDYPTPTTQHARIPTPQPPTSSSTPVKSFLFTPPIKPAHLSGVPTIINNDATLTNASLKIHRPALLATLYADRPRQCTTCGRRFAATAEGQARKSRHLDAHFRTNRKFAEMEDQGGRGVSRSWYVGEVDWIGAKEWDDADQNDPGTTGAFASTTGLGVHGEQHQFHSGGGIPGSQGAGGSNATGHNARASLGRPQSYIKAPVDAALTKYICPICQDEFKAQWHDDAQEWVWMDAVRVGDKVFHESCLGEMAKDRGTSGGSAPSNAGRTSTPLAATSNMKTK